MCYLDFDQSEAVDTGINARIAMLPTTAKFESELWSRLSLGWSFQLVISKKGNDVMSKDSIGV